MLRILEIGVTHKDRTIMWTLCREERGALKKEQEVRINKDVDKAECLKCNA